MAEVEEFDALVASLYEAALQPSRWAGAIARLARCGGADGWHMLAWDERQHADLLGIIGGSLTPSVVEEYNAHYGALDPRRELAARSGVGVVIACQRHFDERYVANSAFYQDYMRRYQTRYSMGASLYRSETVDYQLGLLRGPDRPAFSDDDEAMLTRLMPHFGSALRLMERSAALERRAVVAEAGLETTALAVFSLRGAEGTIVQANRRGEALLVDGTVLQSRLGRLCGAEGTAEHALAAAIRHTSTTGRPTHRVLQADGEPSGQRYSITLMRQPDDAEWLPHGRSASNDDGRHPGWERARRAADHGLMLCLAAPLGPRRIATARQLMELFGLSPAEAPLARAVAAGVSAEQHALDHDVQVCTVRSQMRAVLAKTGTDRQIDLARLLGSIPPVRDPAG